MKMFDRLSLKAATALTAVVMAATPALAEDKVTAVHAFPGFLIYTRPFLAMVDDINTRGKGIVQIEVKGGPEAIGMFQQPTAVRDGVVEWCTPPAAFTAHPCRNSTRWLRPL